MEGTGTMTERWVMTRLKKEQLDIADKYFPGIPRWRQFNEIFNASIFGLDQKAGNFLFGNIFTKKKRSEGDDD